ncbi:MAG TPA: CHAT domain-containing protein [Bryobacteraceae bacterium]|nr:CHAT domain-containing protein [Bryobacteraceae bacterium]
MNPASPLGNTPWDSEEAQIERAIRELHGSLENTRDSQQRQTILSQLCEAHRQQALRHVSEAGANAYLQSARRAFNELEPPSAEVALAYGRALLFHYECLGDPSSVDYAFRLFENWTRSLPAIDSSGPFTALAQCHLERYRRDGNLDDLEKAAAFSLPIRHVRGGRSAMAVFQHASALHESYRSTGSINKLNEAMQGFELINRQDERPVLSFGTGYAEALLDRHAVFGQVRQLSLAIRVAALVHDIADDTYGAAQALCALGCGTLIAARTAEEPEEQADGVSVIEGGYETLPAQAIEYLRRAVKAFHPHAPGRPLALARLADALLFRSRVTRSVEERMEAVEIGREAVATVPPRSPSAVQIQYIAASVLRWASKLPSISESESKAFRAESRMLFERAAERGARTQPAAGFLAALEWSTGAYDRACAIEAATGPGAETPAEAAAEWLEVVRGSNYLESALGVLLAPLEQAGQFGWDLLGEEDYLAGDISQKEQFQPRWFRRSQGYAARLAFAWARLGHFAEAVRTIENSRMLLLDRGMADWRAYARIDDIAAASAVSPLVYIVTADCGGALLSVNRQRDPLVSCAWIPELSTSKLSRMWHGEHLAREFIEGAYSYLAQAGAKDWQEGGFLGVYHFWHQQGPPGSFEAWERTLENVSAWLGAAMLEEIERAAAGSPVLALVATGIAGLFPLQAMSLPDASRPTGRRYLGDRFAVRFVPRARTLLRPAERAAEERFLGVEEPQPVKASAIPFAAVEMGIAESGFPNRTVLRGAGATPAALVPNIESATAIHFCCHALSHFFRPLHSAILLANDEHLPLAELAKVDWRRARLVVLSACETGKTSRKLPDQLVTLAVGLLGAGAQAVLASAWDINDASTAILMLRFYHEWRRQGIEPLEALRSAQQWTRDTANLEKAAFCRSLLPAFGGAAIFSQEAVKALYRLLVLQPPAERSFAHPHHWAAFTYQG